MTIRMNTAARAVLALSLAGALGACDQGPLEGTPPIHSAARVATLSGADVARALAAGLDDAAVRAAVHAALRQSPLNENKLVLGDFVRTPAGRRLVSAAAFRSGVAEGRLLGAIAGLGETDFYLPVAGQRQTWRGEAVLVGYTADPDLPMLTAYDARGATRSLDARNGAPAQPLLILHPGEPKWERREADRGGARFLLSGGDDESCPPNTDNCEHDGDGGGSTGPTADLNRIYAFEGDGWGDIEIMIKHYTASGGTELDEWIGSGFDAWEEHDPNVDIRRDTDGQTWVKVWERDSGYPETGGDDFWGEGWMAASGQTKTFGVDGIINVQLTYTY